MGKIDSRPDLEPEDVSKELGAAVGPSGCLYFRATWLFESVISNYAELLKLFDLQAFAEEVEVSKDK